MPIKAIVTDIEGTTSSLSFVKEVLFPYAREHLAGYVRTHADTPEVRKELALVHQIVGSTMTLDNTIAQLIRWIDEDKKITPLKTLQGYIWEEGYRNHRFLGHIYDDAVIALRNWHAAGKKLYVYSSGSVQAQKLLYRHTAYGDLTPLFTDYFDTRIGAKVDAMSYRHIAETAHLPPAQILFLSDIVAELDAAVLAGMQTYWLVREGAPTLSSAHRIARNFGEIEVK
ncbi:MAG: acireductone synthase [Gammaproteobacteria bacterium]|nr:acireductone synthase [Gammaproteobacteria bacterium]